MSVSNDVRIVIKTLFLKKKTKKNYQLENSTFWNSGNENAKFVKIKKTFFFFINLYMLGKKEKQNQHMATKGLQEGAAVEMHCFNVQQWCTNNTHVEKAKQGKRPSISPQIQHRKYAK